MKGIAVCARYYATGSKNISGKNTLSEIVKMLEGSEYPCNNYC
jgi:hypothetical protein